MKVIVDQELQDVLGLHEGLVAHADAAADADILLPEHELHRTGDVAALRYDGNVAGGGEDGLHHAVQARRFRADDSGAVGAYHGDIRAPGGRDDIGFERLSLFSEFGESGGDNHTGGDTEIPAFGDCIGNLFGGKEDKGKVDRTGYLAKAPVDLLAQDLPAGGIDRVYGPPVAASDQVEGEGESPLADGP